MADKYRGKARKARAERRRWTSCERKVRFETEVEAWQGHDPKGSVYACRYGCGGWHRAGWHGR